MFIRRTQTRSTASGEVYFTYRLVRSERVDSKVRQRTLLNLGRHFEIAQPHWPALCRRVEEILTGQLALEHDATAGLETHAQRIAAQQVRRHRATGPMTLAPGMYSTRTAQVEPCNGTKRVRSNLARPHRARDRGPQRCGADSRPRGRGAALQREAGGAAERLVRCPVGLASRLITASGWSDVT